MGTKVLYISTLAFAVGVGISSLAPVGTTLIALLGVIVCGLAALAIQHGHDPVLVLGCVALASVAFGMLRTEVAWSGVGVSPLVAVVGNSVVLTGTVAREPDIREHSRHLYVDIANDTVLMIVDRYVDVQYGDVVEVSGMLAAPTSFTTDLGRTINYPGYLLARGVEFQMLYPKLTVHERGQGNVFIACLLKTKQAFLGALGEYLPEPQRGLAAGVLLGVKQALGKELETTFRTAGITHIIVLSGYNVMIIVTFVTTVLSYLLPLRARAVVGIAAIAGFALMVGLSATVLRASIMAAFALVAQLLGRTYLVLRALLVAGAIMLVINPWLLLYDIGFQLSFMATLGLLLVAPEFESRVPAFNTRYKLREFFIATIAAQVAVLPLLLYHMGQLSLVAVAVNMLVLPMVAVAMLLSFITGVCALVVPLVAPLMAYPTYAALTYIITIATWGSSLPGAAVAVPYFPLWALGLAYALLGCGLYYFAARSSALVVTVAVDDWLIEDERVVMERVYSKDAPTGTPSATIPIFFRK